jgi:hypothetical protein
MFIEVGSNGITNAGEGRMRQNRMALVVLAAVVGGLTAGCFPPPCLPPPPQSPASQCADVPPKWPSPVADVQKAEENLYYGAKLSFAAVPQSLQMQYQSQFDTALKILTDADNVFEDAVNAILTSNGADFTAAMAALATAVQTFVAAIEPIFSGTSTGQAQLQNIHAKTANVFHAMGR